MNYCVDRKKSPSSFFLLLDARAATEYCVRPAPGPSGFEIKEEHKRGGTHHTQSTSSGLGVRRVVKLYVNIFLHETGDAATALERESKREKRTESRIRIPSPAARRPRPRLEYDSSATGSPAGRSGIEPAPLHRLAAAGSPRRAASPSAALAAVVAHTCGRGRASGRGLTAALWVRAGPVRAGKSGAVCALRRVRARGGAWGGGGAHLAWAARLEPPGPAKGPVRWT